MQCEYCKKTFKNKNSLYTHQTKTKYCLKIQEKNPETSYTCQYCSKVFIRKDGYEVHLTGHLTDPVTTKLQQENNKIEEENKELKHKLEIKDETLKNMSEQIKVFQEETKQLKEEIKVLQEENLKNLQKENIDHKKKIDNMTKKYVKKQARIQYDVPYVIYILTTPSLKTDRRYILGKAENLTNRLSTYNKTDEHEVVYYQGCGDLESMGLVESFVFRKLKDYREQANRERFILPEGADIEMFIDVVKSSVEACK